MRVTQWGEYGIHCSAFIANCQKNNAGVPVGAAEIAAAQNIALDYAQQILLRLRRGNIINSIRGPHGGYELARSAEEITLLDVLVAAEGEAFQIICETKPINAERCNAGSYCGLRPIWFELRDELNGFLTKYTLAELADRLYGKTALSKAQELSADNLIKLGNV